MERKEKERKGLILKTLERCRSLGQQRAIGGSRSGGGLKAKSWPWLPGRKPRGGCFSVYVGPARERFAVRTECANHPLFKMLLDEAEMEYGYAAEGPLELPCNVDLFLRVIGEMDQEMVSSSPRRCGFARSHSAGSGGYQLLSPSRAISMTYS